MANPVWTFGAYKNLKDDTTIAASGFSGIAVDFTDVMEGKVQIEVGGFPNSVVAGVLVTVHNVFYGIRDSIPLFEFIIPSEAGYPKQVSFSLLSGYYDIVLVNLDATYTIVINATSNTLSWPS